MNTPERHTLYAGKYLSLKTVNTWEYVEREGASGVVGILAITAENNIVLVEQYRPALGCNVIQLPEGLAGDIPGEEHEALATAAHRELLEETGYQAATFDFLLQGPTSAGLTNEVITFFKADGLTKVAAGGGDSHENITVHEVPLDGLEPWLTERRAAGVLVDFSIYAVLYSAQIERILSSPK